MTPTSQSVSRIAEAYFKPVDGGYLFEMPNPWLLASSRRYIVNEQQKSALLDVLIVPRQGLVIALGTAVMIAYICAVCILWVAMSFGRPLGAFDLLGASMTIFVPLYAAAVVWRSQRQRRLEPIVATAVPTQAKFSAVDRYRTMGASLPTAFWVVAAAMWGFSAVPDVTSILHRAGAEPLLSDHHFYMTMLNVLTSSIFTVFAVYVVQRRLRQAKS